MAMKINTDACTACGDCALVCPNQAIIKKSGCFAVSVEKCNGCEQHALPKCQHVCPSNCIEVS